jgi:hypothetical protein
MNMSFLDNEDMANNLKNCFDLSGIGKLLIPCVIRALISDINLCFDLLHRTICWYTFKAFKHDYVNNRLFE